MLTIFADGHVLRPYVILKGEKGGKISKELTDPAMGYPLNVLCTVQSKANADQEIVEDWIARQWLPAVSDQAGNPQPAVLVLDSFAAHISQKTKDILARMQTTLVVIPGGLTRVLQPIDVSINHPLKVELRKAWSAWMSSVVHQPAAPAKIPRAPRPVVVSWIVQAWSTIGQPLVAKSFEDTGLVLHDLTPLQARSFLWIRDMVDDDPDEPEIAPVGGPPPIATDLAQHAPPVGAPGRVAGGRKHFGTDPNLDFSESDDDDAGAEGGVDVLQSGEEESESTSEEEEEDGEDIDGEGHPITLGGEECM